MRRVAMLALFAAGCGRFLFDPQALGDAAVGSDASDAFGCIGTDEDGDGIGDACDLCPTISDSPVDTDGDGVGDACDPRPTMSGDYIQVVDFHRDPMTPTYSRLDQSFAWTADALRLGADADFGQANFLLPALPTRIEVRLRVISASTNFHWFGFWYGQNQADTEKIFATGQHNVGVSAPELILKEDGTGVDRFSAPLSGPTTFAAGQTYTLIIETGLATGGADIFKVVDATGTRMTSLVIQIQRERLGFLEANNMIAEYDYFVAYAIR